MIFGAYSIKIATVTSDELGIEKISPNSQYYDEDTIINYEVRQVVFHIANIPTFPIKKIYVRKGDKTLENVSPEIEKSIHAKTKFKTPWYSFLFPILLCIGLLSYFSHHQYKIYKRYKSIETEFYVKQKTINLEIAQLSPNHFIELREDNNWITTDIFFLKIEEIGPLYIHASVVKSGIGLFDNIMRVKKDYKLKKDSLQTIKIKKEDFNLLLINDPKVYLKNKHYRYKYSVNSGLNIFEDKKRYVINNIYNLNGPVLKYKNRSWHRGNVSNFNFYNYGDNVQIIKIENLEGYTTLWNVELPLVTNEYFTLQANDFDAKENTYGAILTLKDSVNTIYKYKIYTKEQNSITERVYISDK